MSTKIDSENGVEIEVSRLGIDVTDPEAGVGTYARLTPWQRRELADALHEGAAVVIGGRLTAPESQHKRERDVAVERTKHLEREVSKVEGRASEWSVEAQKWRARAEAAEKRLRQLEARPWTIALEDKASPVFMPAVTRAEIDKVVEAVFDREAGYGHGIDKPWPGTAPVADAVWDYLKSDDPAVYVVRESDIAAVAVEQGNNWRANGTGIPKSWTAEQARRLRDHTAEQWCEIEAIARSIEAEQAVDPVEAKARELAAAGGIDFDEQEPDGVEMLFGMARHVLGQEADQ